MGFLIGNVHRVGAGVTAPSDLLVLVGQFQPACHHSVHHVKSFRNKIWKISPDDEILKDQKLLLQEDLTQADRMGRNWLWPLVETSGEQGKRAGFRGPRAYIEGKK
ncbi:hypothetical protein ILYODFUR_012095 [Ilyodon furcidens]|uniref:Uncharacterized protein n=1 Tax=Ilyodon furcidens TaxID=33524 RepID=A0ABV0VDA5_9TELE